MDDISYVYSDDEYEYNSDNSNNSNNEIKKNIYNNNNNNNNNNNFNNNDSIDYDDDYDDDNNDDEEEYIYTYDTDDDDQDIIIGVNNNTIKSSSSSLGYMTTGISSHEKSYDILEPNDIEDFINSEKNELSSMLGLEIPKSAIIMRYYNWDKEKLLENFFSNPDHILMDSGIEPKPIDNNNNINNNNNNEQSSYEIVDTNNNHNNNNNTFYCKICLDDFPLNEGISLSCNHMFCEDCFIGYLISKVNDGPSCIIAKCPYDKCNIVIPENIWKEKLENVIYKKYLKHYISSFVEMNKNFRWCPGPDCSKAVMATSSSVRTVRCKCGFPYCFNCGFEAHAPVNCKQLELWNEKNENESETAHWMLANTKKCPSCSTRIEKNQGCNHMTCRQCRHEFCWICGGPWSDHNTNTGGYYKCNRWKGDKEDTSINGKDSWSVEESKRQKAKRELDRYLHYYQRYHNHDNSLRFAEKLRKKTETRMIEMQEREGSAWIDVQFLKSATDQLIESRRVLKYTYALGYFLKDGSLRKQLFEDHQENLEKFTEKLHELSELPFDSMKKSEVVNYTRVTESFLRNLLVACEEMEEEIANETLNNDMIDEEKIKDKIDPPKKKKRRWRK